MGQEVNRTDFNIQEEQLFYQKLREETKLLNTWFKQEKFSTQPAKCGLELEAWLTTDDYIPSPNSDLFVQDLNDELVVPEISKYNFELNSDPLDFKTNVFSQLERNLDGLWKKCSDSAKAKNLKTIIIGSLPTLRDYMLDMEYLSPQTRYLALNNNVMKLRGGAPIKLQIEGKDLLNCEHDDVITECAATSLQIHYGITLENSCALYNASVVSSSFMAAISANSPFLFGSQLWDETRIPIFEQSVNLKSYRKKSGEYAKRVGLGNKYVEHSLMEIFIDNLDGYPILLFENFDSPAEELNHFKLHNGTIWRWNRPLVGKSSDGLPGLRIEFRVPSAGPTIKDSIANMMFQIGMVEFMATIDDLTKKIEFTTAEDNFYAACKYGLNSKIKWIDGDWDMSELMLQVILPGSVQALLDKGIDQADVDHYLNDIIKNRIINNQNGSNWQKSFVKNSGMRFQELMEKYHHFQSQNIPVYKWGQS